MFASKFGWQTPLYVDNATKEGYAAWFLANSNLTERSTKRWKNWIVTTVTMHDTINEHYDPMFLRQVKQNQDIHRRVVFAKTGVGIQYMFFGVYKVKKHRAK